MGGIEPSELDAFLGELAELSRKYNIVIRGCGCCESPWIERPTDTADMVVKPREEWSYRATRYGDYWGDLKCSTHRPRWMG